jgi:hypothetical protein
VVVDDYRVAWRASSEYRPGGTEVRGLCPRGLQELGGQAGGPIPGGAAYGIVLLISAIAYFILQSVILAAHRPDSPLRAALGRDLKGKLSPVCYLAAIPLAFVNRWIAVGLYLMGTATTAPVEPTSDWRTLPR